MEFKNYEEETFWKQVFLAVAAKQYYGSGDAKEYADNALIFLRERDGRLDSSSPYRIATR